MEKHLHIICLEVPYPVNYGGVYDLFYKLKALQAQGIKIHLHCFTKDRTPQAELSNYCEEVFYYPRNLGHKGISKKLPYIVASRYSEALLKRLLQDDFPVFMEGVHSTYLTTDARFKNRKKFVRVHNIEHEYYHHLFQYSHHLKKTIYYWWEEKQLVKYEAELAKKATAYWTVTMKDAEYYRTNYACNTVDYLPLFIPDNWNVISNEGRGTYCLYHGNLEVEENEYAAIWLAEKVFKKLTMPLIIAGKNPSKKISAAIKSTPHITIVANPDEAQMQDMIHKAHINVLPSFSNTGIKIKVLNALYNGRHCVVNDAMVAGTSLTQICHVVKNADEFKERLLLLYHQPFTVTEKNFRIRLLSAEFSNKANAKRMINWIWNVFA